jgi:hypothetical protein
LTDDTFPRQIVPRIAAPAWQASASTNTDSDGALTVVMHSVATTVRLPRADDYMHDLGMAIKNTNTRLALAKPSIISVDR